MKLLIIIIISIYLAGCGSTASREDWAHRATYIPNNENIEEERAKLQSEIEQEKINRNVKKESVGLGDIVIQSLAIVNSTMQETNNTLAQQNAIKKAELIKLQYQDTQQPQNTSINSVNSDPKLSANATTERNNDTLPQSNNENQQVPKNTTIVLGTPTYSVTESVGDNATDSYKHSPANNSKATEKKVCKDFSDVDGMTCRYEKVAVCKENEANFWFCYGHLQYTQSGEKGEKGLSDNLRYAGCKLPHNSTKLADNIYLYYCDEAWRQSGAESIPISTIERQFSVKIPDIHKNRRKLYYCPQGIDDACSIVRKSTW